MVPEGYRSPSPSSRPLWMAYSMTGGELQPSLPSSKICTCHQDRSISLTKLCNPRTAKNIFVIFYTLSTTCSKDIISISKDSLSMGKDIVFSKDIHILVKTY